MSRALMIIFLLVALLVVAIGLTGCVTLGAHGPVFWLPAATSDSVVEGLNVYTSGVTSGLSVTKSGQLWTTPTVEQVPFERPRPGRPVVAPSSDAPVFDRSHGTPGFEGGALGGAERPAPIDPFRTPGERAERPASPPTPEQPTVAPPGTKVPEVVPIPRAVEPVEPMPTPRWWDVQEPGRSRSGGKIPQALPIPEGALPDKPAWKSAPTGPEQERPERRSEKIERAKPRAKPAWRDSPSESFGQKIQTPQGPIDADKRPR